MGAAWDTHSDRTSATKTYIMIGLGFLLVYQFCSSHFILLPISSFDAWLDYSRPSSYSASVYGSWDCSQTCLKELATGWTIMRSRSSFSGSQLQVLIASRAEPEHSDAMVPWFVSPIKAWNEKLGSFSPRHEASILELFFDLFFVANLATFTQYHAITSRYNFWSYVAFFFVLWTTWFHVVCFDARFAADSVWERTCKLLHFLVFAAFALVGYKFQPVAPDPEKSTPHWVRYWHCYERSSSTGSLTISRSTGCFVGSCSPAV